MEVRLRRRGKCRHFLTRQRSGSHPRLKAPSGRVPGSGCSSGWRHSRRMLSRRNDESGYRDVSDRVDRDDVESRFDRTRNVSGSYAQPPNHRPRHDCRHHRGNGTKCDMRPLSDRNARSQGPGTRQHPNRGTCQVERLSPRIGQMPPLSRAEAGHIEAPIARSSRAAPFRFLCK